MSPSPLGNISTGFYDCPNLLIYQILNNHSVLYIRNFKYDRVIFKNLLAVNVIEILQLTQILKLVFRNI